MAEGTIRITEPADSESKRNGDSQEFRIISADEFGESTANNGTPRNSSKQQRRAKRAALSATDRKEVDESNSSDTSDTTRRTPPPAKSRKTVTEVKHYLTDTEALSNSKFYLASLEMMAVSLSGPRGEMTEFERSMMTPALRRVLKRIPLEQMEKGNVVLDSILLTGGMVMYMNHAAGGFKWSWPFKRPQKKGVQTDMQSPVSQPMETVVNTTTGDIDGLAIPVPDVFKKYMDNSI